ALDRGSNETVIAEFGLESARERFEVILPLSAPGAKKLLTNGVGADHFSEHVLGTNENRPAGVTKSLLLLRVGFTHARVTRAHQDIFAWWHQIKCGQQRRGPGAERISKVNCADLCAGIEDGRHGDSGLLFAIRRRR